MREIPCNRGVAGTGSMGSVVSPPIAGGSQATNALSIPSVLGRYHGGRVGQRLCRLFLTLRDSEQAA